MTNKDTCTVFACPDRPEIIITHEFDAPQDIVFKAFTVPGLYAQWLGPRSLAMTIKKFEPWDGGSWRYAHRDEDGREYGFHGVFHEVTFPERIIDTIEFEGNAEKGHVSLETILFEPLPDNRTHVTIHALFQTVADRDAILEADMDEGVRASHERLNELLEQVEEEELQPIS